MNTPILKGKNIGPVTAEELCSIGIDTLEKLMQLGWERAYQIYVEAYPHRINVNCLVALIGACKNQHWQKVSVQDKMRAKQIISRLKSY